MEAAAPFSTFIDKRKARYTAQALEIFEDKLEGPLKRMGLLENPEIKQGVEEAKAAFRSKIRELATDATDTMPLTEYQQNAAASEITSPLRATGADTGSNQ